MRNIHVPAYCPSEFGVQAIDQSGVFGEVKKVIAIESAPISELWPDIDMELSVEDGMLIADIVLDGDISIVMLLVESMTTDILCC